MPTPSTEFTIELGDLIDLLATGERMVTAQHYLGAYEEPAWGGD